MNRVMPKMNIQTDIFNEEEDYPSPQTYQYSKESDILNKEKGILILESFLTSLYIKNIYIPFRILAKSRNLRSYSSKDIKIYKSYLKSQSSHEQQTYQRQSRILNKKMLNRKKSISDMQHLNNSHSIQMLKESRRVILETINEKLKDSSYEKSSYVSREKEEVVNKKIQKLERLRKNIISQKTKSYIPTKVYQKKQVSVMPKKEQNTQMNIFLQELQKLREQVTEIRQMNQNILNSRVKSQPPLSMKSRSPTPFQNNDTIYNPVQQPDHNHKVKTTVSTKKHEQPLKYGGIISPGYTKPELLKQLGLKQMPESNQSIKSFNIIDNEEYPNKSSQKSVNNQSSYVYSKSSRKPSVEKFQTLTPKVLFTERSNTQKQLTYVHPPVHHNLPINLHKGMTHNNFHSISQSKPVIKFTHHAIPPPPSQTYYQ